MEEDLAPLGCFEAKSYPFQKHLSLIIGEILKINFSYKLKHSLGQLVRCSPSNSAQVGGQAVLEGVMLRSKDNWVIAVRREDGEIAVEEAQIKRGGFAKSLLKIPVLRGITSLFEMLVLGTKAITLSLNMAEETEGSDEEAIILGKGEIFFSVLLAFGFSILLFIIIPSYLIAFGARSLESPFLISFFEGLIRVALFIAYLLVISHSKEIGRVFEYHGAEHKVIHALEAGDELTVEAAAKHSPLHVGCGTAFIIIAFTILILVFAFLGRPPLMIRIAERLLLAPLVVGLSYEIIKLARKYGSHFLVRAILAPGLYLQKLTTKEPSTQQIEVALVSLKRLLELGDLNETEVVEILQ
ncbi:MAG: DUF1385 domain-containing protein [Actinomycetota bacterium]|nr:DUF1385 domain-containing protein [Actinomycetota bacterium]